MVENSFRRASWLSVWKARFLRTLVLMDRTWEGGRAEAERTVHYKQQRALSEALRDQEKDLCLCPNSSWLHEEFSLSMEICLYFCEEQTTREGKNVLSALVSRGQGAFLSFLLCSKKGSGVMRKQRTGSRAMAGKASSLALNSSPVPEVQPEVRESTNGLKGQRLPVIPALGRLRQEDHCKPQASQDYMVRDTVLRETLSLLFNPLHNLKTVYLLPVPSGPHTNVKTTFTSLQTLFLLSLHDGFFWGEGLFQDKVSL